MPSLFSINLFFSLIAVLSLQTVYAQWLSDEQPVMGTMVRVELWHPDPDKGNHLIDEVMQEMHRIDGLMSPYKKDSQISLINRQAARSYVTVSKEVIDLIARSVKVSELTSGAFDITYASVGRLFDYRQKLKPSRADIDLVLPAVDYRFIDIDNRNNRIKFKRQGVYIDLGGIAKGHAVDKSIQLLQQRGVKHAIVTAGGDSRIIGDRRGRPWVVGIRHPRIQADAVALLPLQNEAISTSGDYERFFIENGKRYHHILNPRSGTSVTQTRSATVIGPDATMTDALSTSVFVMGRDRGLALIESIKGFEAVVIDRSGKMYFSSGLQNIANKSKVINSD
jgi:FAD:protein FMN transferase